MWNFRNEMEDKWSYVNAYDKGWINQNSSDEVLDVIDDFLEILQ